MGDVHHCSGPPVSEMTYTVSSGTLNSTIPYHTQVNTNRLCQAMRAAGVTPQQLQMVLQQRLSVPGVVRHVPSNTNVQSTARLPIAAVRGSVVTSGARPSFAAAFTKNLSASPAFKAPLPPPSAASLPKAEKRKFDTLRLVIP